MSSFSVISLKFVKKFIRGRCSVLDMIISNMSMKRKEFESVRKKVVLVLKRYNIKRAGFFGSYVRGEQKKSSDVDVLVEINDKKMSLLGFIHIKNELERVLGKKVDLVEYKLVRPEIKAFILKEEVRIL